MAVREWMLTEQPDLQRDSILKLVSKWDNSISVLGV